MNNQNLPAATQTDILVYQGDAGVKMTVKTDGETVWLTQEQMCKLFGRERSVITKHIKNIFKEGELPKEGYVQNMHITSDVGGRPVSIYNLDVVISVGYRVKSIEGTRFRQFFDVAGLRIVKFGKRARKSSSLRVISPPFDSA